MTEASPVPTDLDILRATLRRLAPAGPLGFEGLLAKVLSQITGGDFRLAKSGSQHGKDGDGEVQDQSIAFEAKRYDGPIPDNEVLTKIARLIAEPTPRALWILGATTEVSTQLADTARAAADTGGIAVFILDWPTASPAPALAVACALASEETLAFLREQLGDVPLEPFEEALRCLALTDGFEVRAEALRRALLDPSWAGSNALAANALWLGGVFTDRSRAKAVFGQTLAPGAAHPTPARDRQTLQDHLDSALASAPQTFVALLGSEGHGKSWLFAQTWMAMASPPITIVIPASDFLAISGPGQIETLIIDKLIEQTGSAPTEVSQRRWRRHWRTWAAVADSARQRVIVYVDGLNEQPVVDWGRWLEATAQIISPRGGVLAVSSRQAYFDLRIRPRLLARPVAIPVPPWSDHELTEILTERGVDRSKIPDAVFEQLRNPRMLGIAFDLLDNVAIETFTELSPERLLFEHIRIGARTGSAAEPPEMFVKRLAEHAQAVLERANRQQGEDRLVFEHAPTGAGYTLTADLGAVVAEHFYRPLEEDPTLYTLAESGLSLALGVAVIRALQKTARSARDVSEALGELLDPIAALDLTAEAVFAAATVASIDDRCSLDIRRALIAGLLTLQNIDHDRYSAFVAVVRNAPQAATLALADVAIRNGRGPNDAWLAPALQACRTDPEIWSIVSAQIASWLGTYSLDPRLGIFERSGDVAAAIQTRSERLDRRLAGMSPDEQAMLATMTRRDDIDPAALHRIAFDLLAGMPLASFAPALVASTLSMALNSPLHVPWDAFYALIRFNRRDWAETRAALLAAAAPLSGEAVSSMGRWARVMVLRATATAEDTAEEDRLVEELTAGSETSSGWRLVEKYCATDPCDPDSAAPDNLASTIADYDAIDPSEVSKGRDMGRADHFLADAAPAMARFAPETAIRVHRCVAAQVIARNTLDMRLALTTLERHGALLQRDNVEALARIAIDYATPHEGEDLRDRDSWMISQWALLLCLPHMDGEAQAALIADLPDHGAPLLRLAEVFKPCAPATLDRLLATAAAAANVSRKLMILSFVRQVAETLSQYGRASLALLARDPDGVVRSLALALAAELADRPILTDHVASGWSAEGLENREDFYEIWYGSYALVAAGKHGLIEGRALLDRVSPKLYGQAVEDIGDHVGAGLARRIAGSSRLLLSAPSTVAAPTVEQAAPDPGARPAPRLLSLVDEGVGLEDPEEPGNPLSAIVARSQETDEAFQARTRAGWQAFHAVEDQLTRSRARLAVENIEPEAVEVCVAHDPDGFMDLAREMIAQPPGSLSSAANFGLMLAQAINGRDPCLSADLFERLADERPVVTLVMGPSSLPFGVTAIWSANGQAAEALRRRRLDSAASDHELSQQVLAGLRQGRQEELLAYARDRLQGPDPVSIGRGLTVLGFGLESSEAEATLRAFSATTGFIGEAAEAALFAYDRNRWARHWLAEMAHASSPEAFWRASVLFLKLVDARISVWGHEIPNSGEAMASFWPGIQERLKWRADRWKTKREKTLFGGKIPAETFLSDFRPATPARRRRRA